MPQPRNPDQASRQNKQNSITVSSLGWRVTEA
jgi:hypothetical protein